MLPTVIEEETEPNMDCPFGLIQSSPSVAGIRYKIWESAGGVGPAILPPTVNSTVVEVIENPDTTRAASALSVNGPTASSIAGSTNFILFVYFMIMVWVSFLRTTIEAFHPRLGADGSD